VHKEEQLSEKKDSSFDDTIGSFHFQVFMDRLKRREEEISMETKMNEQWKLKMEALGQVLQSRDSLATPLNVQDIRTTLNSTAIKNCALTYSLYRSNAQSVSSSSSYNSNIETNTREYYEDVEDTNEFNEDAVPNYQKSKVGSGSITSKDINFKETKQDTTSKEKNLLTSAPFNTKVPSLVSTISDALTTNSNYFKDEDTSPSLQKDLDYEFVSNSKSSHLKLITELPEGKNMDKEGKINYKEQFEEQNGLCPTCGKGLKNEYNWLQKPRYCFYTHKYYCKSCHNRNEKCVIPAKVLWEWNFTPLHTCNEASGYLKSIYDSPLIVVSAVNPKLFDETSNLRKARMLRKRLMLQWDYIEHCPQKELLMKRVKLDHHNLHYVTDTELYSLHNLVDLNCEPNISPFLKHLAAMSREFSEHITTHCGHCIKNAKTFCSANCKDNEPIFEFNFSTVMKCSMCNKLFHKKCFMKNGTKACPKCSQ